MKAIFLIISLLSLLVLNNCNFGDRFNCGYTEYGVDSLIVMKITCDTFSN